MDVYGGKKSILYFLKGSMPTVQERDEALTYGLGVKFRNAGYVEPDASPGSIEAADYYAGTVPDAYRKHFPDRCIKPGQEDLIKGIATGNIPTADELPANQPDKPSYYIKPGMTTAEMDEALAKAIKAGREAAATPLQALQTASPAPPAPPVGMVSDPWKPNQ